MALLHEKSCLCVSSQLDLFAVPGTQTSQEKSSYVPYYPLTSLEDGPLEFDVKPSALYTDLSDTRLYLKVKIVDATGVNLDATEKVTPVNMFFHALFQKLDLFLGDKLVTQSSGFYPWKAGIETLLNFGYDAKSSHLNTIMYYKNTSGTSDIDPEAVPLNHGLIMRHRLSSGSKPFELYGPLHVDLFFQEKYLLSNMPMRIKLSRSPAEFCLMSANPLGRYKVQILDAILWIRRVQISPAVELSHAKALTHSNALYPINRTEIETISAPLGARTVSRDNFFAGKIPRKLIVAMLSNKGLNGDIAANPYNFQHFSLQNVELTLDGDAVAGTPISCDFPKGLCMRGYNSLFNALNKSYMDAGNDISYADYFGGYTLFCFDLTADGCGNSGAHMDLGKAGNLRLKLQFAENLVTTINVLVYGEFELIIEITKDRQVLLS